MEKIGQKTRNINFYSEKNGKMVCLHSRHARDYAKYLEAQSWVERYEAGPPLSQELYAHVSSVGIRGAYFQVSWASDFLIQFADGRKGIRELVAADGLRRKNIIEKAGVLPKVLVCYGHRQLESRAFAGKLISLSVRGPLRSMDS